MHSHIRLICKLLLSCVIFVGGGDGRFKDIQKINKLTSCLSLIEESVGYIFIFQINFFSVTTDISV